MRLRILASSIALAIAIGLLSASPASASYSVTATFPGGGTEFYSPFDGPARISFAFAPSDPSRLYRVRLRRVNTTTILKTSFFSINPSSQSSPVVKNFSWPALSTTADRPYEVLVNPNGGGPTQSFAFVLKPRLVRITGAAPNPFFPWIDDGYKDTTNVKFALEAAADAEARVYRATTSGGCCGPLILDASLGPRPSGSNAWAWDGQGEASHGTGGNRPQGNYFVRIWASDGEIAPSLSKPFKVVIKRTYRATATKSKPGTQYHHTTESALVRGGDCFVHAQGGYLQVDCHGSKMSVYYRWGLSSVQQIQSASFVIDNSQSECGTARRKAGHSKHESFLTVTDSVSGITSCRIVTAKITYSFPKSS
jgi:hypothetical protein